MHISFHLLMSLKTGCVLQLMTADSHRRPGDWCDTAAITHAHVLVPGTDLMAIPDGCF